VIVFGPNKTLRANDGFDDRLNARLKENQLAKWQGVRDITTGGRGVDLIDTLGDSLQRGRAN